MSEKPSDLRPEDDPAPLPYHEAPHLAGIPYQRETRNKYLPFNYAYCTADKSQRCWQYYNEWIKCVVKYPEDSIRCTSLRASVSGACPWDWIEKWDEQRKTPNYFMGYQGGPSFYPVDEDEEDDDDE